MARKADLEKEISEMNKKYKLKDNGIHVGLSQAYGGYQVVLRGGETIGTGYVDVTHGHDTATNTLNNLYKKDSKGDLEYKINYWKNEDSRRKKELAPAAKSKPAVKKMAAKKAPAKKKPTSKKKITATAKPKPAVKKMAAKKAPVKKK